MVESKDSDPILFYSIETCSRLRPASQRSGRKIFLSWSGTFAQHFARDMTKEIHSISAETMNTLVSYPWPGNVRELQNVIEARGHSVARSPR